MPNGNHDYKLGEHEQRLVDIDSRLRRIESKVDSLNMWRFKTVGFASGVGAVIGTATTLILKFLA